MQKLSLKKYVWKCVLGAEIFYFSCLLYGSFLTGKLQETHHTLIDLIPGFSWTVWGVSWGAIYLFVIAWVFGSYMVWMYNTSLIEKR